MANLQEIIDELIAAGLPPDVHDVAINIREGEPTVAIQRLPDGIKVWNQIPDGTFYLAYAHTNY